MANGWCVIDKGNHSCTMAGLRKALWEGPLPVVGTGAVSGPASPDHACAGAIPVAKSNRSAATPKRDCTSQRGGVARCHLGAMAMQ